MKLLLITSVVLFVVAVFSFLIIRSRQPGPLVMRAGDIRRNPQAFFKMAERRQKNRKVWGPARTLTSAEIRDVLVSLGNGVDEGRSTRIASVDRELLTSPLTSAVLHFDPSSSQLREPHWLLSNFEPDPPPPNLDDWLIKYDNAHANYMDEHLLSATGTTNAATYIAGKVAADMYDRSTISKWTDGFKLAEKHDQLQLGVTEKLVPVIDAQLASDASAGADKGLLGLRLALDPKGTFEILMEPPYWVSGFESLGTVLYHAHEAATTIGIQPPSGKILGMESSISSLPADHRNHLFYGRLVLWMVELSIPRGVEIVYNPLGIFSPETRPSIMDARLKLAGITEDYGSIARDVMEDYYLGKTNGKVDPEAGIMHRLTAIFDLTLEVNNGACEQYFFNSAGDEWPVAREGLDALAEVYPEMKQTADAFHNAVLCFGRKTPPSRDRVIRIDQLSKLGDEELEPMGDFTRLFFDSPLEVAMALYVLKHLEVFKAAQVTYLLKQQTKSN